MPDQAARAVGELSPREFENLTFDLLQMIGMERTVWRTPGPDGGRDIEGVFHARDAIGYISTQRWYVECKRYEAAIDWPTVWGKIAYADNEKADFLLLVTSSNPSPHCETQIDKWNQDRRPLKLRVWRGYELEQIISQFPSLAIKYGLRLLSVDPRAGFLPLAMEGMKFAQSAYVAHSLGSDPTLALEAVAAVSELLSSRMEDVKNYGRLTVSSTKPAITFYQWLTISEELPELDEVGLRAILSTTRYLTNSESATLHRQNGRLIFEPFNAKLALDESARKVLREIAVWSAFEIGAIEAVSGKLELTERQINL